MKFQKTLTINTDGGSRGNPGPSAYAFVVREDNKIIHTDYGYLGVSTNNQAEYMGVLKAMEWFRRKFMVHGSWFIVIFVLDSQLVARQLSGLYKIKDEKLRLLAARVKNLEKELGQVVIYNSVPRSENKDADLLVNQCLDTQRD